MQLSKTQLRFAIRESSQTCFRPETKRMYELHQIHLVSPPFNIITQCMQLVVLDLSKKYYIFFAKYLKAPHLNVFRNQRKTDIVWDWDAIECEKELIILTYSVRSPNTINCFASMPLKRKGHKCHNLSYSL